MTAQSKAGVFAAAVQALDVGWTVTRQRGPEGLRAVEAERAGDRWRFVWRRGRDGRSKYVEGWRWPSSGEPVEWFNVAEALRQMAKPSPALVATLPDAGVLAELAGRTIRWRNSISGNVETATVPKGGLHLKLASSTSKVNGARVLSFASADGAGFRSVRLDTLVSIS